MFLPHGVVNVPRDWRDWNNLRNIEVHYKDQYAKTFIRGNAFQFQRKYV